MTGSAARSAADRHDLRLVLPALTVWLVSLILLRLPAAIAYAVAVLAVLVGLLATVLPFPLWSQAGCGGARRPVRPLVLALLVCTAAASAGVGLRLSAVSSGPVRELARAGTQTEAEAAVTGDPHMRRAHGRPLVIVRARAEAIRYRGTRTRVRVPVLLIANGPDWARLGPGLRIRFTGRMAPPRGAELLAAVAIVRGPPVVIGRPSAAQRAATLIRDRLRLAADGLPPAQQGVLPGMVLGDTSRLDPALAEDFATAGLTHLMVVSGSNLAIIIVAVLRVCGYAGAGRRRAPLVAAAAVTAFVVVARPDPSVLRATVMGMVGLLAMLTGRERQGLPALGAAVIGLVLADPGQSRSYSFALSVSATAGLLLIAPRWREALSGRCPRPVADVLATTAAAHVACTPVLIMLSGRIGLVAIVANLLAEPAVAPATLFGAVAALIAPLALAPARLLLWPAGHVVGWIIFVARTAAAVPYATVPWPKGLIGALLFLAACVPAAFVVRSPRLRPIAAAALAGLVVAVAVLYLVSPGWPPRDWFLTACDIGQGDGLALNAGHGRAVVVDAGPEPRAIDRCLDDLGVRTVPLLVLTHPHADHIDGVPGVRSGRRVGTVLGSPLSEGEESRFLGGLSVGVTLPGRQWTIGRLTLSVLWPPATGPRVSTRDPGTEVNNVSVVLVARGPGMTVLLSGDVEKDAQRALVASVPRVDVLKVPHHGSAAQEPDFLRASGAGVALISVGADNDYGHPAPVTLALLRRFGMRIFRTDLAGDVAVFRGPRGVSVMTHRAGR